MSMLIDMNFRGEPVTFFLGAMCTECRTEIDPCGACECNADCDAPSECDMPYYQERDEPHVPEGQWWRECDSAEYDEPRATVEFFDDGDPYSARLAAEMAEDQAWLARWQAGEFEDRADFYAARAEAADDAMLTWRD